MVRQGDTASTVDLTLLANRLLATNGERPTCVVSRNVWRVLSESDCVLGPERVGHSVRE